MRDYPVHYKYREAVDPQGLLLIEDRFYPIRETKCFYFILPEWQWNQYKKGNGNYEESAKRVSKNGLRRKCYPTKELAFNSYLIRKKKQIWHNENALKIASYAVDALKNISSPDELTKADYRNCMVIGKPKFIEEEYNFC